MLARDVADVGVGSMGAGGGVVAIVYPIHAAIIRTKVTARNGGNLQCD